MVETHRFGDLNGQPVTAYTLTNQHGMKLTCLDYGATWFKQEVPHAGRLQNLILSSPHLEDYMPGKYQGKIIGRVAGRIGQGQYHQAGHMIPLPANEGTTTLHGGPKGFSNVLWTTKATADQLIFTHHFREADDGFPGNMDATVTYTLGEDDTVTLNFTATSDADTLFNPTSHVYWNLNAEDETIDNHQLSIQSDAHFALAANKVPTGLLITNAGTPYDFRASTQLGTALAQLQDTAEQGFDDIFAINPHSSVTPIVQLSADGVRMRLYSSRNALVMFTSNHFGPEMHFISRTGRDHVGLVLEAQTAPSALSDPRFGDITLKAGRPRHEQIRYAFDY